MTEMQSVDPNPDLAAVAYLVGRDAEGHWLALETHGLGGGLFVTEMAALRYARAEVDGRAEAVRLSDDVLTLRI